MAKIQYSLYKNQYILEIEGLCREGRSLSLDEIEHLKKVIKSLEETIKIMDKIDQIPLP